MDSGDSELEASGSTSESWHFQHWQFSGLADSASHGDSESLTGPAEPESGLSPSPTWPSRRPAGSTKKLENLNCQGWVTVAC